MKETVTTQTETTLNKIQTMYENMTTPETTEVIEVRKTRRTKAEMEDSKINDAIQSVIGDEFPEEVIEEAKEQELAVVKRTDRYVYAEKTIEALEVAYKTNKNIVLFGPGGHSKSTLSLDFMRDRGHEPFVVTMGKGMTIDRLFGGLDLKLFQSDGKIEYLAENSFMNQEYVIFEELFDSPDYILEQLKDVLSSRILRNGGQIFPLKTKFIICNTNRTREDFAKSNSSLLALLERFPLELEVRWKDYNRLTYENLLNSVHGFADPMLTYVLEEFAKAGHNISPRIAIEAADVLEACGPGCFEYIADFASHKDVLKKALTKYKSIAELMMFKQIIDEYSAFMEPLNLDEMTGKQIKEVVIYNSNFQKGLKKIKKLSVEDGLNEQKVALVKEGDLKFNLYNAKITSYTTANGVPTDDKGNPLTAPEEIDDLLREIEF